MTQGTHYRCDYRTFSHLLGFDHHDHDAPSLFDIFVNGYDTSDLENAEIYKEGYPADGKNTNLKTYFYVLNNLICNTIDPKIGDSLHLQHDAPKILIHFGANGCRFCVSDFMWYKIEEAANDPHKSLSYAPYLMHIIEQVVGCCFSYDCNHPPSNVRNLGPHLRSRGTPTTTPLADPAGAGTSHSGGAPSSPPRSSLEGRDHDGGAVKYALRKFFSYFYYKAERDDRRLCRLEEQANITPPSPLRLFADPFDEYESLYGAAPPATRAEASFTPPPPPPTASMGFVPSSSRPSSMSGDASGDFDMGRTSASAYDSIFGGADALSYQASQAGPSSDPYGKSTLVDYGYDDDDDDY
jgi:hypothetical protein